MKTCTQREINEMLTLHQKWQCGEAGGVRADFCGINLIGMDLSCASLYGANFSMKPLDKGASL